MEAKMTEARVAKSTVRSALVKKRCNQVAGAAVLLFSTQGYHKTTILEISGKAGVSVGLIYKYFNDKDDILFYVLLQVIDAYKDRIPRELLGVTDKLDRFKVAVSAYCKIVDSMRAETILAYRSTKSLRPEMRKAVMEKELETNRIIADCIRECVADGIFRPVNLEFMTYQVVLFCHGWALKHWRLGKIMSVDEYIAEGTEQFLQGLMIEQGNMDRA